MALNLQDEIAILRKLPNIGQFLGLALEKLQDGVNSLGKHIAVDANGTLPAPPQIQALTVKTDGNGNVHAVITDNNPIQKNLNYFVEYSNSDSFLQAHVEHLGPSRTMRPMPLPAFDDNGNPQNWFFHAYSQYPGSLPSEPIRFGGTQATPVAVGGTSRLTLIPSTGSGTAQSTGQESGSGFGKVLQRAAVGPKRNSA